MTGPLETFANAGGVHLARALLAEFAGNMARLAAERRASTSEPELTSPSAADAARGRDPRQRERLSGRRRTGRRRIARRGVVVAGVSRLAQANLFRQRKNRMSDNQVSDVLAQAFAAEGVDTLFTLMGDANMYWSAAMADNQGVRLIHARHEHCACAMADAYARASGKVGVASVTCGPGFTQIMTALIDGRARQRAARRLFRRRADRRLLVHAADRPGAVGAGDRARISCRSARSTGRSTMSARRFTWPAPSAARWC